MKTLKIEKIVKRLNKFLQDTNNDLRNNRLGVCVAIEYILHQGHVFKGFRYLTKDDLLNSEFLPGVNLEEGDLRFKNTDDSRREYYL